MKKMALIFLVLFINITIAEAQRKMLLPFSKGRPELILGFNQGQWTYPELGISLFTGYDTPLVPRSYDFTIETNTQTTNFIIAPKITYNATFIIFNIGFGGAYYTNLKGEGGMYARPHVGLSLLGYIAIVYGKNFQIGSLSQTDQWVNDHQISIILLPFAMRKDIKKLTPEQSTKTVKL